MTSDHVFGSDELTPELLRAATFAEVDGRVDSADVRTFLDRVATSLEVFMSADAPTALRAEFSRNAEIAQQVLDAGQNASEQLRRQAAEEAKRILDEARDATLGLRETVESEIEQARTQVESMRSVFMQDLRDLYDRIGASLYRFERADEESRVTPIREPTRSVPEPEPEPEPAPAPAPAPAPIPAPAPPPAANEEHDPLEGIKPPAWQQLPAEAWSPEPAATWASGNEPTPAAGDVTSAPPVGDGVTTPVPAGVAGGDPFAVVEDEPLAPGEPLVDLRDAGFGIDAVNPSVPLAPTPGSAAPVDPEPLDAGTWLEPAVDMPPVAPQAAPPAGVDTGGSWLEPAGDMPLDPGAATSPSDPIVARDDALAEALIREPAPDPTAAAPEPPAAATASPDAVAVRQLILDALAAGQTRDTIEAYLRDQLGLLEPGVLVDAALGSVEPA